LQLEDVSGPPLALGGERVADVAPRLSAVDGGLGRHHRILAGGAGAAAALAVAKLYLTFPGSTFATLQLLAGGVFLGATTDYLIHRPAAKRVVWPAER